MAKKIYKNPERKVTRRLSNKHGKHRHVSKNTLTRSRLK